MVWPPPLLAVSIILFALVPTWCKGWNVFELVTLHCFVCCWVALPTLCGVTHSSVGAACSLWFVCLFVSLDFALANSVNFGYPACSFSDLQPLHLLFAALSTNSLQKRTLSLPGFPSPWCFQHSGSLVEGLAFSCYLLQHAHTFYNLYRGLVFNHTPAFAPLDYPFCSWT